MGVYKQIKNHLRFAGGMTEPLAGPAKILWEITHKCNSKCLNCTLWQRPSRDELNTGQAKAVIWQASRLGTMHISFSGGETLLRRDIVDLVRFTRRLGLKCSINSNGTLVDKRMATDLARARLNTIFISLDSAGESINDSIRGVPGSYRRALEALEALISVRANSGMRVFVNSTINNMNWQDMESIAGLCKSLGVDGWTMSVVQNIESYGPSGEVLMDSSMGEEFRHRVAAIKGEYPALIPYDDDYIRTMGDYIASPEKLYRFRCLAGYSIASIMPNGDLQPCPAAFHRIGNLREASLKSLWFSPEASRVREQVKCGDHPICCFDCIAPLNIMLDDVRRKRWFTIARGRTLRHLWRKVVG